ncbi:MAG: carbohydrate porin [Acidithiobacillus sp.]|nr:carbohydrate porin [Acidithiobacillus sp.]
MKKSVLALGFFGLFTSNEMLAAPISQSSPEVHHSQWWKGISFTNQIDLEGVANLSGGQARGSVATGLWQGSLRLDTEKAGWWQGGAFVVEGLVANSGNPDNYVGDLQGVSNLTTPRAHVARLYKAYYRQNVGQFTFRLGILNPNDYFNTTGVASELFNASFGIYPTISINLPYTPTYPYSSLGAMLSYTWQQSTLLVGAFNADGTQDLRHPWGAEGQIYYGEWDQLVPAGSGEITLKLGGYYNHVSSAYLAQNTPFGGAPSQGGYYGAAEYRWKAGNGSEWGAFLQGGGAPNSSVVSPVNAYVGAGLRLRNFLPGSARSTLTIGLNRAWLRQSGAESAIEINFRQPVFHSFYLQPDLQYIINPGARAPGSTLPNAVVLMLRVGWSGDIWG